MAYLNSVLYIVEEDNISMTGVMMTFADRVSAYNRNRKWQIFLNRFNIGKTTTLLDVGFSDQEYSPIDNYIEKYYPYPEMITALGIEEPELFLKNYPKVKAITYDGTLFPFEDNTFDICWSNAVIEHVGDAEKQILFIKEIKRVSKQALITTPNKHFPIESHTRTPFLHWLPKSVFDAYLRIIGRGWAADDYMRLLTLNEIKRLLKESGINDYEIIKNRLCGFTLDFVILF